MLRRWILLGGLVAATIIGPATVIAQEEHNEAPLAEAGLDQHVELGSTVLLDATGSRDPDGEIQTYAWRIHTPNGKTIVPQCPVCGQSRFQPTTMGTYTVTITVTDTDGATSTDTLYVTVEGSQASSNSSESSGSELTSPVSESTPPPSNPTGIDPPSTASSCSASSCEPSMTEPWLEINGPSNVARDEQAGFVLEYGGFRRDPQFGWSIGADGVTGVQEWNSPGEKTIYVTGATDSRIARASHTITVRNNQKPMAEIQYPDDLYPGQQIKLSVDASDQDGWIENIRWIKGPEIVVPEGLNQNRAEVIVTDNDGAKSREVVYIDGDVIRAFDRNTSALHTVYCYYTQEPERKRQDPDHCEIDNSDNSDDGDGYQSVTSNLARMLKSPHYNIVWKKTDEEIRQHSGDVADDVGVRMPDVVDNDGSEPTAPTLTEGQKDAITGDAATTTTQSFTLEGKTVSNDLNGDGEIDAGDWDERFGSDDTSPADTHRDAVREAKDARRSTNRANGGGGPAAVDDENTGASSTDSSEDSTGGSGTSGNGGSSTDPLGGELPDSLTDVSVGDHAAEKGERIADGGLSMGAGY